MQNEKLRYQPNKKAQMFVMIAMIFMAVALFRVINVFRYTNLEVEGRLIKPNLFLGLEILIAIFATLLSFLLGEKYKTYDFKWSFVGIGLTIYPLVKIFIYPIILFNRFQGMIVEGYQIKYKPVSWLIITIVLLVLSSVFYFIGTYINFVKIKQLKQYYKELETSNAK